MLHLEEIYGETTGFVAVFAKLPLGNNLTSSEIRNSLERGQIPENLELFYTFSNEDPDNIWEYQKSTAIYKAAKVYDNRFRIVKVYLITRLLAAKAYATFNFQELFENNGNSHKVINNPEFVRRVRDRTIPVENHTDFEAIVVNYSAPNRQHQNRLIGNYQILQINNDLYIH